jgi:TIR domain
MTTLIKKWTQVRYKIFISYRRKDSFEAVRRLHSDLKERCRNGKVFRDESDVKFGDPIYSSKIEPAVKESDLVLALIGPEWDESILEEGDNDGMPRRRLDQNEDPVRTELRLAFENSKVVIPILLQDAIKPGQLPSDIQKLTEAKWMELDRPGDKIWDFQLDELARKYPRVLRTKAELERFWQFWTKVVVMPAVILASVHLIYRVIFYAFEDWTWFALISACSFFFALFNSWQEHIPKDVNLWVAIGVAFLSATLLAIIGLVIGYPAESASVREWTDWAKSPNSLEYTRRAFVEFLTVASIVVVSYLVGVLAFRTVRPGE